MLFLLPTLLIMSNNYFSPILQWHIWSSMSPKGPISHLSLSPCTGSRLQHASSSRHWCLRIAATGSAPSYIHSLLRIYIPSWSLRSASKRRLTLPSQRGTKSHSRTFSFTVPGCWNDLPTPIRNDESLTIFKRHLKTHIFLDYLTSFQIN